MTSMILQTGIDNKVDVWHIDTSQGLAQAQIWPSADVPLEWADGTIEVIPARTRCLANPGGTTSVDLTSLDYYLVTYEGAASAGVPPSIVPITALGTLDTLFAGQTWQLLAAFGKWGSRNVELSGVTSGLPAGVKGDILYYDGTTWVTRHIGNQGDVLYVDTGLPVWTPSSVLIKSYLPTNTAVASPGDHCLSLWNGSGNNAPPRGWQTTSFDDSLWPPATVGEVISPPQVPVAGGTPIWPSNPPAGGPGSNERALIRTRFTLGAGPFSSAVLTIAFDDYIDSIWVNGNQLAFAPAGGALAQDGGGVSYSMPVSYLLPGAVNVIAVQASNIWPSSGADAAWVSYTLAVS